MFLYKKPSDRNGQFLSLAERCMMGDVKAMADFAGWFRHDCSQGEKSLIKAYEKNPEAICLDELKEHIVKRLGGETFAFRAYMMWMVRAALYGNEETMHIVERCSYYNDGAYLPRYMFLPGTDLRVSFGSSETLYRLGFTDFDFIETDCKLFSVKREGYYVFRFVSYYEPPDEDGFGMEIEYEDYYFDEFFCRIPVGNHSDIPMALARLRSMREHYWENVADSEKTGKFNHYMAGV